MSHTETKEVTYLDGHRIKVWRHVYQMERTCRIVRHVDESPASYGGRVHRCSACSKALPKALFRNGWTVLDYCPRCGSRVVGCDDR